MPRYLIKPYSTPHRPWRWGLACVLLLGSSWVQAAQDDGKWNISLLMGIHSPVMPALNKGLLQSPLIGNGQVIYDEQTGDTERYDFRYDSRLPEKPSGPKSGFQLEWRANEYHSFLIGIGSWEKTALGVLNVEFPTQGRLNNVNYERRNKVSYTEYNLGWRYRFLHFGDFNIYSLLSINEIFDFDYREDLIFLYLRGSDQQGFRRIMVTQAQTAALLAGMAALGAEWRFSKAVSLSLEGGYLWGQQKLRPKAVQTLSDFSATDQVSFDGLPFRELSDGTLGYLPNTVASDRIDGSEAPYVPLKLDMSGWQFSLRINIFY